jgi:hypothetical protein
LVLLKWCRGPLSLVTGWREDRQTTSQLIAFTTLLEFGKNFLSYPVSDKSLKKTQDH